ncbi:hypothetical protein RGQ13_17730 [Thalassotalea psychrophila]|uniref:DUF2846 domain-containing protein n=1 Tax=Thalassotalea psychrophila TaxID=3065647 RepID=A0ABY9TT54_9GAMM|nr:hypothetical protein RGQ13_17730 [Colwelliaceae bacterium SQ149]
MIKIKLISVLLCMLVLSSCATKVESINEQSQYALQEKHGYLLLAVDTNRSLKEILLTGTKRIALSEKDLKSGSNYILISLPAGQYEISKVRFNNYAYLKNFEDDIWEFSVEENKINYAGHLKMNSYIVWYYVASRMSLNNNSSIALEFMEDKFSNILQNHSMTYSGPGNENFFELITPASPHKDSE